MSESKLKIRAKLMRAEAKVDKAVDKLAEAENETREKAERMLAYDRVYWETEPHSDELHDKMCNARWVLLDIMENWETAIQNLTSATEKVERLKKKLDGAPIECVL